MSSETTDNAAEPQQAAGMDEEGCSDIATPAAIPSEGSLHHHEVIAEDGHLLFDPEKKPERGILKRPGESTSEKKAIPVKMDANTEMKESNPDKYINHKIEGKTGLVQRRKSGYNLLAKQSTPEEDEDSSDEEDEDGPAGVTTTTTGATVSGHEREKSEGIGKSEVNGAVDGDKEEKKRKGGFTPFGKKNSKGTEDVRKERKDSESKKDKKKPKEKKDKEKDKDKVAGDKEKEKDKDKEKEKEKEKDKKSKK